MKMILERDVVFMSNKIISILLVEDNKQDCAKFIKYIKSRNDIKLVGTTDSDIEALELIKKTLPDVLILDIELHNGSGNANSFGLIENLQKIKLNKKPKIIVNTIVSSNTVYDYLHNNGVDLIFYKKQKKYSIENIINTITLLNKDEISFQTRVAYSEESISENIVKEEESLTDQMRHYRFRNTVTVLELMNSYYDPKSVLYLPKIEIKDGEIKEKEAVVFKEGKRWESFR